MVGLRLRLLLRQKPRRGLVCSYKAQEMHSNHPKAILAHLHNKVLWKPRACGGRAVRRTGVALSIDASRSLETLSWTCV